MCGRLALRCWAWVTARALPVDTDVVDLGVSELVTNSVRHTASGREGGGVDVAMHMVHASEGVWARPSVP